MCGRQTEERSDRDVQLNAEYMLHRKYKETKQGNTNRMIRGKKENLYNHQNKQTFLDMRGNKRNKMATSPCTFTDICCGSKIEGVRNIKLICSMLRIDYKGLPAGEQNHSTAGCYGCESISSFLINTGV